MKRTITKIVCAALCAVMLIGAATPAFAFSHDVSYQANNNLLGIKITCSGHAYDSPDSRSTIVLTFLPNVPHQPAEDYSCSTVMTLFTNNSWHEYSSIGDHMCHDTGSVDASIYGGSLVGAEFYYYLNNSVYYHRSFGTVWCPGE